MKKLTATAAAALLLAACAEKVEPAQQFRDVLPKAADVQLGVPAADGTSGALSVSRDALGQSPSYGSEYAITSYWTAVTANVGVWYALTLVQVITAFPPSACEPDVSCTWGPWPDDDGLKEWKFYAEKVGDAYDYQLSARPILGVAEWTDVLAGHALPGVDRHHGSGTLTIFFDAQDAFPHPDGYVKEDYGTLAIEYDNTTDRAGDAAADLWIVASLENGKNDDPNKPDMMNVEYSFLDSGAGGTLALAVLNQTTTERVSLYTRWDATGAGRSDVRFSAAGGATPVTATECWVGAAGDPPWVPAWGEVYDSKVPFGDEATDCVFHPAQYVDLLPLPVQ